ncbi:MAG TPA: hypothetical protein VGB00_10530 [Pyrinomonadaceae bacterium]
MKKNLSKFLISGLFLFAVTGCGVFNKIKSEIDNAQKPQVIVSTDGKYQITAPGGWQKQTSLNDEATLQAANLRGELYVIVISESKEDIDASVNLDLVTDAVKENLTKTVTGATFSEPVSTTVNGLPAKQFEVSGEVEKIKVTYLYSLVDAPQNYYQVITWTLTPRFESGKGKLQEVINSFKETGISAAPPLHQPAKTPAKR